MCALFRMWRQTFVELSVSIYFPDKTSPLRTCSVFIKLHFCCLTSLLHLQGERPTFIAYETTGITKHFNTSFLVPKKNEEYYSIAKFIKTFWTVTKIRKNVYTWDLFQSSYYGISMYQIAIGREWSSFPIN